MHLSVFHVLFKANYIFKDFSRQSCANPEVGKCVQQRFKSVCISTQSDQSLSFPPEEIMDPSLPIERSSKTQIRLCQVFFDFSLTVKAAPHECVIRTGQP